MYDCLLANIRENYNKFASQYLLMMTQFTFQTVHTDAPVMSTSLFYYINGLCFRFATNHVFFILYRSSHVTFNKC